MKTKITWTRLAIAEAVLCAFSLPLAATAQQTPVETVVVTGTRVETAPYQAPSQASLDAGEPQSVISQHFIENNATTAANYTDIIAISPSVVDTTPNGRGLAESLNTSIRGFQDGQFNVTFDGIPWGDSNDFTHHSTSYFTANTIGNVTVDRGPGTASQIGNATFGGTVALQSKDPMAQHNANVSLSLGSWRTQDYSAQYDTGTLANGERALIALTSIKSDGYMTNNGLDRKNVLAKYVQPVSADTSITAVAMYNTLHQNVSQFGTTYQQLQQFGSNYSLNTNPSSEAYYGFNYDDIHTDFEYVDVKTKAGGWRLDNKLYTYAYYHNINETNDPSYATSGAIGVYDGGDPAVGLPTDVGGQKGYNNYRSWGDIVRAEDDIGPGTARVGAWVDQQKNSRLLYDINWTANAAFDVNGDNNGYQRELTDTLVTMSPFAEYEFKPIESVTLTPGLRYTSFKRHVIALHDPNNGLPSDLAHTWSAWQPSIYALDRISGNWSAYAQAARGFLAPYQNLLFQQNKNPGDGSTQAQRDAANAAQKPSTTVNLQAGTTWKSDAFTVSADVYHIDFNNWVNKKYVAGGNLQAVHGGGAIFKGVELEATAVVGMGFSVYGNTSKNDANFKDSTPITNAPKTTSVLGLIYEHGPLYGSLIGKHVGSTYQSSSESPGASPEPGGVSTVDGNGNKSVSGYTVTDLNLVYTLHDVAAGLKNLKLKFDIANLGDKRNVYYIYGANLAGADEYMTLPGRSYTLGFSADF